MAADRAPPGLLAMIPRVASAISRRLFFPEMVPQDGDICLESLRGLCANASCKLVHPPLATSNIAPMAPSIVAAHQALQAHAATQAQSSKHSSEETASALALNNMEFRGRPLNVEMPKSLPPMPISNSALGSSSMPMSLPNHAVTELAAAITAEIKKNLLADKKARSPSPTRAKSRKRSRSFSPTRHTREYRSIPPVRSHHYSSYGRVSSKDINDKRRTGRDLGRRSHGNESPMFRRKRSRSSHRRESRTERRKSARPDSTKSSSSGDEESKSRRRRRSLSKPDEAVNTGELKRRKIQEQSSRRRSRSDSPVQ